MLGPRRVAVLQRQQEPARLFRVAQMTLGGGAAEPCPRGHLMGRERRAGTVQYLADEVRRRLRVAAGQARCGGHGHGAQRAEDPVVFLARQAPAADTVDRAAQNGAGVQRGAQRSGAACLGATDGWDAERATGLTLGKFGRECRRRCTQVHEAPLTVGVRTVRLVTWSSVPWGSLGARAREMPVAVGNAGAGHRPPVAMCVVLPN